MRRPYACLARLLPRSVPQAGAAPINGLSFAHGYCRRRGLHAARATVLAALATLLFRAAPLAAWALGATFREVAAPHTALNHALPVDGGGFGLLLRSRTALPSVAASRTSRFNDSVSPAAIPSAQVLTKRW